MEEHADLLESLMGLKANLWDKETVEAMEEEELPKVG